MDRRAHRDVILRAGAKLVSAAALVPASMRFDTEQAGAVSGGLQTCPTHCLN